jgi:hypothetical protein
MKGFYDPLALPVDVEQIAASGLDSIRVITVLKQHLLDTAHFVSRASRAHDDLHMLAEPHETVLQLRLANLAKLPAQHFRQIGLRHAEHVGVASTAEVDVGRLPRRQVVRHGPPLVATAHDVENRVHNLPPDLTAGTKGSSSSYSPHEDRWDRACALIRCIPAASLPPASSF